MSDAYIWIDPARKSGEPCIGGTRLDLDIVVETVWHSGADNALDLWPQLSRGQVLVACWYVGAGNVVRLHGRGGKHVAYRGPWRKRWGSWAAEVHQALWSSTTVDYDAIPDPPEKPPDATQGRSEAARALPVPRTELTDTTTAPPADATSAMEETTVTTTAAATPANRHPRRPR